MLSYESVRESKKASMPGLMTAVSVSNAGGRQVGEIARVALVPLGLTKFGIMWMLCGQSEGGVKGV